jgi:hypothetical protein
MAQDTATPTKVQHGVISKYDRAGGEEAQARIEPYKGRDYFSIRCWYVDSKDGNQLKPGRNGLNLPVDEAPEFLRLVVALFPDKVQLIKEES